MEIRERKGRPYLSIIVIKGATIEAAANPENASDANLNPRFFVLYFLSTAKGSVVFGARVTAFEDGSKFNVGAGGPTVEEGSGISRPSRSRNFLYPEDISMALLQQSYSLFEESASQNDAVHTLYDD